MTSHDEEPGLAYLAMVLVALVVVWFAAKIWLAGPYRDRRLWLVPLALTPAVVPPPVYGPPWRSEGHAGWSSPHFTTAHPYTTRWQSQRV